MDWRYNTIWFDQIAKDKFSKIDCNEKSIIELDLNMSEYCIIWHYKSKNRDFGNLPSSNFLKYLELNWANSIDFRGLEKYHNLKRLELHYCTKLESDLGLSSLKNSLEHLHVDQSKKFKISDELKALTNLKVLSLNNCAPIENGKNPKEKLEKLKAIQFSLRSPLSNLPEKLKSFLKSLVERFYFQKQVFGNGKTNVYRILD